MNAALVAAGVFISLGISHFLLVLRDAIRTPRYFCPADRNALEHIRSTHTAISSRSRPYWTGVLGFHVSHALGVVWFGSFIAVIERQNLTSLRPLALVGSLIYAALAWRTWFWGPLVGISVGALLLAYGWLA